MSQNIHWTYCQTFSDQILAEGALALQSQPLMRHEQVTSSRPGNYLISCNGKSPFYVGEAKNLTRRIKQQFKATTSTFHKTVLKAPSSCHLSIDSFQVQYIDTRIGRKELEEFCIVNVPTELNRFQLGKCSITSKATSFALWTAVQALSVDLL